MGIQLGDTHDEGHIGRPGKVGGLAPETVVAQMFAMVGIEEDGRVVVETHGAQFAEEAPQLVVNLRNQPIVATTCFPDHLIAQLRPLAHQSFFLECRRIVIRPDPVAPDRIGDGEVVVHAVVGRRRIEGTVGRFEDDPEKERHLRVALGQEADGLFDDPVGVGEALRHGRGRRVDLVAAQSMATIHAGVGRLLQPVDVVIGMERDVFEAHARPIRREVHLADGFGLVTALTRQPARQAGVRIDGRASVEVEGHAEVRRRLPREHGHALGHTDRAVGVGLGETRSLGGQLVDVGRHHRMLARQAAQAVATPLIGGDHRRCWAVSLIYPWLIFTP